MSTGTSVARVTHIIAESPKGFDDAVQVGFKRAASTLRGHHRSADRGAAGLGQGE